MKVKKVKLTHVGGWKVKRSNVVAEKIEKKVRLSHIGQWKVKQCVAPPAAPEISDNENEGKKSHFVMQVET